MTQCRCIVGSVATHADGLTSFLECFDELVLILGQDAGEDRELPGMDIVGDRPGWADGAIKSRRFATMAAVAGASPVTITVRMPKPFNSLTSAAESLRGGSPSAMRPASFIPVRGPAATASTRKPLSSSSLAKAAAVGDAWARPITTV